MPDLSTEIAGLKLRNPTILASGILGQTGQSLLRAVNEGGAGAVVTKSIGLEPKEGHGNPCVVETEHGLINAMGLPNPGIEYVGEEIHMAVEGGATVIGSIYAGRPEDFPMLATMMVAYGVKAIELNLSCPHAEKFGLEVGADPELAAKIVRNTMRAVRVPIFPKLSPMLPDIKGMARTLEKAGAAGIVAVNTVKAMKIEPELGKPVLANKFGGLSGPALKPIGVRCVYDISSMVKIPVIGVGGIVTGNDALEYIMAGASAVQIGSGVHYRGIGVFGDVCKEIGDFMDRRGYGKLSDIVGIARRDG